MRTRAERRYLAQLAQRQRQRTRRFYGGINHLDPRHAGATLPQACSCSKCASLRHPSRKPTVQELRPRDLAGDFETLTA